MKHIAPILTLPLTIIVVAFAVKNRDFVPLDLWPFELAASVPVFVLVLGSMFLGFLIGALTMWLSSGKRRRQARVTRRRLTKLERDVQRQQDAVAAGTTTRAAMPMVAPPRRTGDPGETGRPAA